MSDPITWEEALDLVLARVRQTLIQRHRKYGPKNIAFAGELGIAIRIGDKAARLLNNVPCPLQPTHSTSTDGSFPSTPDDTIEDAYIDAAGYGCIGLIWRAGHWYLPLIEKLENASSV